LNPDTNTTTADGSKSATVPYERFAAVNKARRAAEAEVTQIHARLDELSQERAAIQEAGDRHIAELERKAEHLAADVAKIEARGRAVQRESWITAAAQRQHFRQASDAVAMIDAGNIDSADAADRAVTALAGRKPHLTDKPQRATVADLGWSSGPTPPTQQGDAEAVAGAIRDAQSAPRDPFDA
jgi:seryl-tRNA synthetase